MLINRAKPLGNGSTSRTVLADRLAMVHNQGDPAHAGAEGRDPGLPAAQGRGSGGSRGGRRSRKGHLVGWRCKSPGVVTALGPFVLPLAVCYQTQLTTTGSHCLPVSCCPHRSDGWGVRNERGCSALDQMITTAFQWGMRQTLDRRWRWASAQPLPEPLASGQRDHGGGKVG
jgi:hypothetical protein